MLRPAKAMLLATAAFAGVTGQQAFAESFPNVLDLFPNFEQFNPSKAKIGPNGITRIIWDNFGSTYIGSNLWFLNPQGQVVAIGDTPIPASVGTGLTPSVGNANIAVNADASGNTTLAFAFGASGTTPKTAQSFGTWTFNSQGHLIAGTHTFGPFNNTFLLNLEFKNDVLIAKWAIVNPGGTVSWAVWTLDEFGNVTSAAGPFGPFAFGLSPGDTILGDVNTTKVNGQQLQLWNWLIISPTLSPNFGLNVWTIDHNGNVTAANSFGPF